MREWRGGIKVVFQLKKARVNIKQLEKTERNRKKSWILLHLRYLENKAKAHSERD